MDVLIFDRSSDLLRKPGFALQEGLPSESLSVRSSFLLSLDVLLAAPHPTGPSQLFQSFSDLRLLPLHIQVSRNLHVCLGDSDSTDVSMCACSKHETNTHISKRKKTLRWCLQGSLRKEFTGQLRANLPPSCARLGSGRPYSSVSFCSQTVHGKQRFTLCYSHKTHNTRSRTLLVPMGCGPRFASALMDRWQAYIPITWRRKSHSSTSRSCNVPTVGIHGQLGHTPLSVSDWRETDSQALAPPPWVR